MWYRSCDRDCACLLAVRPVCEFSKLVMSGGSRSRTNNIQIMSLTSYQLLYPADGPNGPSLAVGSVVIAGAAVHLVPRRCCRHWTGLSWQRLHVRAHAVASELTRTHCDCHARPTRVALGWARGDGGGRGQATGIKPACSDKTRRPDEPRVRRKAEGPAIYHGACGGAPVRNVVALRLLGGPSPWGRHAGEACPSARTGEFSLVV
jgi:hypothetical protein